MSILESGDIALEGLLKMFSQFKDNVNSFGLFDLNCVFLYKLCGEILKGSDTIGLEPLEPHYGPHILTTGEDY